MNTAQTLFTQGAKTQQVQTAVPWIAGAAVFGLLLVFGIVWFLKR